MLHNKFNELFGSNSPDTEEELESIDSQDETRPWNKKMNRKKKKLTKDYMDSNKKILDSVEVDIAEVNVLPPDADISSFIRSLQRTPT